MCFERLSKDRYLDTRRTGNVFKLTNGAWPADPAYFKGRYSNGPVWVEVMAKKLGLKLNDFAFGGGMFCPFLRFHLFWLTRTIQFYGCLATSDNALVQGFTGLNSTIPVPSATDQVATYLSGKKTNDIRGILFTIMIGGNNIFFNPNVTAKQSVDIVATIIDKLESKGGSLFKFQLIQCRFFLI